MVVEQNEKVEEVKEKQTVANVEVYGAEAELVVYITEDVYF